jgi:endonuclease/exonuclease/phosphatase family metal-dependent hydrolase
MIRKLKIFTIQVIMGANIATIIIMILIGFSDRLNPTSFPMLSNVGLAFPLFIVLNLAFLVFWLLVKPRLALVPFLGFIVGYSPMRKYCPVNVPRSAPHGAIKILSYNVWDWVGWEDSDHYQNPILQYIKQQNADIVCLQESNPDGFGKEVIDSVLAPLYAFRDTAKRTGGDCISIYSKFPILSKEHIRYASRGNLSAAFRVMIHGDEVMVINNHFETTGLSPEEKTKFKEMLKGDAKAGVAKSTSRRLLHKLGEATAKRAPEADAVARFMAYHRDLPMIVCGDFNDSPISYVHRTVSKDLTDCYIETGFGPGISYHHSGFFVRIDNILCSDDFEPYDCHVDRKMATSDHYPIITWLKKRSEHEK